MDKQTILITGGAGFIGSHLVKRLIQKQQKVISLDNFTENYPPLFKKENLEDVLGEKNFILYKRDITNFEDVRFLFENHKIEKIVHLAALTGVRPSLKQPLLYEQVNTSATLNLLRLAREFEVKQFIFGSSSSVYGDEAKTPFYETFACDKPVSPYAASKRAAELFCFTFAKLYKIKTTVLRFFTVYGPGGRPDMAPYLFTKAILEGKRIQQFGTGTSSRDYTYIDDIINGIMKALKKEFEFEIINLGSGRPITLKRFIKLIEKLTEKKAKIEVLPNQPGDVKQTYASTRKATQLLNFSAKTPLKKGMKEFIEWFKKKRLTRTNSRLQNSNLLEEA